MSEANDSKTKDSKMNKSKIVNIVCAVLVVVIIIYLFQDIFTSNYNRYDTYTADETVVQDKILLDAFVIRDEAYIDGNSSGTVVPLVADGKRVASGDAVARVCANESDAADFALLEKLRSEKERYLTLENQTELNALDMQKLNSQLEESYADLISSVSEGDYTELTEKIDVLEEELADKQLLTERDVDFSDKIADVDAKIATIEAKKLNPTEVVAPQSGYYISNIDGFENATDYSAVTQLGVEQVEKLLAGTPATVSGKMGKIVTGYKWYIASIIDGKYSKRLTVGNSMKINLPYYGLKDISVTVEKVSEAKDGKLALVLSCNLMNETYANMRRVDAELVVKEYTGYKIPKSSVRSLVAENGTNLSVVYILRGDIMNAKVIDIIYTPTDEDYLVVSMNTKNVYAKNGKTVEYFPIKRYDEVIVKGRDLSNGKSIG